MFASRWQIEHSHRLTISHQVSIRIDTLPEPAIANPIEVITFSPKSLGSLLGKRCPNNARLETPIPILVDQSFDVPWPRDYWAAKVVERHAENVVSNLIVRNERDLKAFGNLEFISGIVGGTRFHAQRDWTNEGKQAKCPSKALADELWGKKQPSPRQLLTGQLGPRMDGRQEKPRAQIRLHAASQIK